ncbi:PD40 domain-containing protein [Actinomadura barringtoniae]|uniref:PD40 domain-containing protein n=1 Tax=Actinomadura barringtoniae TaxID=1427535 RepID=A0A939PDU8_9ACTN|nr:NB-ARC domain-containing protein [Actinomadura barringtoniae]MBO2447424.1 PD40 domain-containing protein [Actinomadura barringtoniae]
MENEFAGEALNVVQARDIHGDVVFNAPRERPPAPAMAPAPPRGFVPRADIQEPLIAALLERRDVALRGAGGFGKTTLACWVCRMPEVREAFPGGVLWVELGQNPSLQKVATSLAGLAAVLTGESPGTYADVPSAAAAFRNALSDKPALLVVDDAWSSADVAHFSGPSTLLVTSRRSGVLEGTEIAVDAMSDAEGAALLEGDPGVLRPLVDRAGHWPLALVMLSGLLRSLGERHGMTSEEAVASLMNELDRYGIATLDELSDADVLRGISRTLDLSLDELGDSRDRLVSLAAFPQGQVVQYETLRRLWDMSDLRVRAVADRFVSRSLASAPGPDGLRLHDVTREALRHMAPEVMRDVSMRLLEGMRPADDGRVFHLCQAGRMDELPALLRDMRYISARLAGAGPLALASDLALARTEDAFAEGLTKLLRLEGHIFVAGLSETDMALTLESRLLNRPGLLEEVHHVTEARPDGGLIALHPMPDVDGSALERSVVVHPDGASQDVDWDPRGRLLATVGYGPPVQIVDTGSWESTAWPVPYSAVVNGVRWSPDGAKLALLGDTSRFSPVFDYYDEHPPQLHALSVHDAATGVEIDVAAFRGAAISFPPGISWGADSEHLAIGGMEGVFLWRSGSGTGPLCLARKDRLGSDTDVDWHPELGLLGHATEGDVGILRHWADPIAGGEPRVWTDRDLRGAGRGLWWRPRGGVAVLALPRSTLLVDPVAQRVLWRLDHRVSLPRWSPDGGRLAFLRSGRLLELWDVPGDGELEAGASPRAAAEIDIGSHQGTRQSLAWRPDGARVAIVRDSAVVKLWRPEQSTERPTRELRHVMWSPDGGTLAVGGSRERWFALDPLDLDAAAVECAPHPFSGRDPAGKRSWLDEVGARREWESGHEPRTFVEFAPGEQAWIVARWFEPLSLCRRNGAETVLVPGYDGRRWGGASFTPSGDRVVAVSGYGPFEKTDFTLWPVTEAAQGEPAARWTTLVEPDVRHVWRVTASETHAVIVANPGLIGLFELDGMRNVCWIRTNATARDAAFDPEGRRLAVVGDAGVYLFEVTPAG